MRVIALICVEGARRRRGSGLQPVNPHRLFVAGDLAEADVDIIAAIQHLARGLGKAALVAVQGRQPEHSRQPQQHADQRQHAIAMPRQPGQQPGRGRDRNVWACFAVCLAARLGFCHPSVSEGRAPV